MIVAANAAPEVSLLLVEDDDDDALLVHCSLNRLSYRIRLERTPTALLAVEQLKARLDDGCGLPDFIILDLNLPVMSGVEFLTWLRAEPRFDHIMVIVLTTVWDPAVLRDMVRRGANAALSKNMSDVDLSELSQHITDLWFHGSVDALEREFPAKSLSQARAVRCI